MQLHGCGYGDDGPLFSKRMLNQPRWDLAMEEGCAYVWKPAALSTDEEMQFVAGGPVLVTKHGAVTFFKPSYGVISPLKSRYKKFCGTCSVWRNPQYPCPNRTKRRQVSAAE